MTVPRLNASPVDDFVIVLVRKVIELLSVKAAEAMLMVEPPVEVLIVVASITIELLFEKCADHINKPDPPDAVVMKQDDTLMMLSNVNVAEEMADVKNNVALHHDIREDDTCARYIHSCFRCSDSCTDSHAIRKDNLSSSGSEAADNDNRNHGK